MTKKKFTRVKKTPETASSMSIEEIHDQAVMPYDESLLERARTQWQFGDWSNLARIERDNLQHHPDRAKLALLAAAGRLQTGDAENARIFVRLAKDWGCSRRLISQILVSGVHNSLGRALALTMKQERAIQHFEKAVAIGMPCGDAKLLSQARILRQVSANRQCFDVITFESPRPTLFELYSNHTGYVSDKWDFYLHVYESILAPYKNWAISLLEIGIQNGGSLEIWNEFFENAKVIVGCDIDEKCGELEFASKKIRLAIGDVKLKQTQDLISSYSTKYDIIIDDGSHKSSDIIQTFCTLFPRLIHGGIYIVEDMHCSYWKDWEGGLDETKSSVSFFKSLIDLLNYEHWDCDLSMQERLSDLGFVTQVDDALSEIYSIRFYNSMCVIEKRRKDVNRLGIRHVVGLEENVYPVKRFDGMLSHHLFK